MPRLPGTAPSGPALVHCDAGATHRLVPRGTGRQATLTAHTEVLRGLVDGRPLWVPTFNYAFCRTGVYDVDADPSEVGPITEFVRTDPGSWRSLTPVFNLAGEGEGPESVAGVAALVDPFGSDSAFADLVARDGVVVWYGAPLISATFVHYAERRSGGPAYRYDKDFDGVVRRAGDADRATTLRYHVRPMGRHLAYDWDAAEADLDRAGVRHALDDGTPIWWASARELLDRWLDLLAADPTALLDDESRQWVRPELDRLGRRFVRTDFES